MTDTEALALSGVVKRFGQALALDGAFLRVRRGSVHALLGENGAGKTTLMRVAFGMLQPDAGEERIDGRVVRLRSPADAIREGLGMVHQHFTNVPAMSVAENVALGGRGRFSIGAAERRVREITDRTGLALDPKARAEDLPVGAQQRLEIVKALAHGARTLILDEPTAVLAPAEADELLRWLRAFANDGGTVVLITHKLREALAIADDVTVLRRGQTVLTTAASATNAGALAMALVGEPISEPAPDVGRSTGQPVVTARGLELLDDRGSSVLRDATFAISEGEIVGIAAVEGSGQRELLRALAGRAGVIKGELLIPEHSGFVPEDRHRDGLVLDFNLTENVAIREAGRRRGLMRWHSLVDLTSVLLSDFDVRGGSAKSAALALSGGNQQKLVLAREMHDSPKLIVAENPTRGLDVRATAAVQARLRAARDAGAAVVLYSSDLDEVLALSSRVLVLHGGTVRELSPDRDAVSRAMLGVA